MATSASPRAGAFLLLLGAAACVEESVLPDRYCTECELRLRAVAALRADSIVETSRHMSIAKLRSGQYVVSHLFTTPTLTVYDSTGRFLRTLDLTGTFESSPRLLVRGDTLFALGRDRMVALDSELRPAGTVPVSTPARLHAALLPHGGVVMETAGPAPGTPSMVRVLDAAGVGVDAVEALPPVAGTSALLAADEHGYLQLRTNTSRLEQRRNDGALVRAVTVQSPWFHEWQQEIHAGGAALRPNPTRFAMARVAPHEVLLVSYVPAPDWSPPGGTFFNYDSNAQYSSIIELVDVRTGAIIASGQSRGAFDVVQGAPAELFWVHTTETNAFLAEIVKVQVLPRSGMKEARK